MSHKPGLRGVLGNTALGSIAGHKAWTPVIIGQKRDSKRKAYV